MNYKNDPLFRFLSADLLQGAGAPTQEEGFCRMKEGNAMPGSSTYGCSLAMVYAPYQHFKDIYEAGEALCRGTLFGELDKPFLASGRGL